MTLPRRLTVVALAALAAVLLCGGAADALGPDCKEAPAATAPGNPIGGNPAQRPTGEDPFADKATTTVYREYGLAVPSWSTYDLGCGAALSRDPTAVVTTFFANGLEAMPTMAGGTTMSALAHGVLGWTGLEAVDRALAGISADLRDAVWSDAVTVVGMLILVWWMMQLLRGNLRRLTTATVYVVAAVAFFALLIGYPQKAGAFFDDVMRSAVGTAYGVPAGAGADAGSGAAGRAAADVLVADLYHSASYRTWCWGMVGTDSAVGREYCPQLWKATHFSYAETNLPANRQGDLRDRKAADFKQVAERMQSAHPGSYQILQGKDWVARSAAAGLSAVLWVLLSLYPIWGLGMVFGSLLLFRLTVALAPALGPVFLHPAMARSAKAMGNVLFGGAVNTIVFTFATAVYLRLAASLTGDGTGMDLPLRLALLLILTVALWVLTKPWRRLTGLGKDLTRVIERVGYRVSGDGIRDGAVAAARGAATVGAAASGAGSVMTAMTLAEMADAPDGATRFAPTPPVPRGGSGVVFVPSTREPAVVPAALPAGSGGGPAAAGLAEYHAERGGRADPVAPPRGGGLRPAVTTLAADGSEVYAIYSASDHSMHANFLAEEQPAAPEEPPENVGPTVYRRGS
ncbi:MAG TPA: hypothetical protein VGO94_06790 [Mycobacteriales bacterium]|nr:hypothetical protein [Mycobacteriales bacterium]